MRFKNRQNADTHQLLKHIRPDRDVIPRKMITITTSNYHDKFPAKQTKPDSDQQYNNDSFNPNYMG